MSETAIPYKRNSNATINSGSTADSDYEWHIDNCPECGMPVSWEREADEWEILDDGTSVPSNWTSWYTSCGWCLGEFICHDDGLTFSFGSFSDTDEE